MIRRPTARGPVRAAVYTRKSTSAGLEQEFNSLDAQREACVAYVQRQPGWVLVDARYDDGGFTGANIDRPAFQRLLKDLDSGLVDVVVVYKVDRLSRSLLDFVKVMERLSDADASFVSVTQNFSTADAMGRLTLNMLMSFAEFEREMIADRTRDKIAASRRKGKWTGGRIPLGFDSRDKRLVVNDLEAITVRAAFDAFLVHRRLSHAARALNDAGHLPRGARLAPGAPRRWDKDSLVRVLRNPVYAGLIRQGDDLHPAEHAAIVPRETFERVARLLDHGDGVRQLHGVNPAYVLRGIVRCGLCGAALTPASTRRSGTEYRYYRCTNRIKHGTCTARPLPAGAIESFVVAQIGAAVRDRELVTEVRRALDTKLHDRRAIAVTQTSKLPGRIAASKAAAARLADELTSLSGAARDAVTAKLSAEAQKVSEAEAQLAAAREELRALDEVVVDAGWVIQTLEDFPTVWEAMTLANRARLLRALVACVEVDEVTGHARLELVPLAGLGAQEAA